MNPACLPSWLDLGYCLGWEVQTGLPLCGGHCPGGPSGACHGALAVRCSVSGSTESGCCSQLAGVCVRPGQTYEWTVATSPRCVWQKWACKQAESQGCLWAYAGTERWHFRRTPATRESGASGSVGDRRGVNGWLKLTLFSQLQEMLPPDRERVWDLGDAAVPRVP